MFFFLHFSVPLNLTMAKHFYNHYNCVSKVFFYSFFFTKSRVTSSLSSDHSECIYIVNNFFFSNSLERLSIVCFKLKAAMEKGKFYSVLYWVEKKFSKKLCLENFCSKKKLIFNLNIFLLLFFWIIRNRSECKRKDGE